MSKENKKEKIKTDFANAIDKLNELRGGVKAFILLALTDEASEKDKDTIRGVNAVSGKMKDLVVLFDNIDKDIKHAAAIGGIAEILGKVLGKNEKS